VVRNLFVDYRSYCSRDGRIRIGLVRPPRWRWVSPAVIAGVAMALAVYAGATALWGHTVSNRLASIAFSYSNVPASPSDALAYKGRASGTNTTAAPQHQGAISRQR
jgi:hypothetical protein